jgi:hypothetical protein
MLFDIKKERQGIEHQYIGFSPNTTNVKPVHLANGMFRRLLGEAHDTRRLFQFVFSAKNDGTIPKGHQTEDVFQWLVDEDRISRGDVTKNSASLFRSTLLKIVAADKPSAVSTQGMESYSAGFSSFVSNDRIAQDAGEFLSLWLSKQAPEFAELLKCSISEGADPITILAKPLFGSPTTAKMQIDNPDDIRCLQDTCPPPVSAGMQKLATAAAQLSLQLKQHPNKLVRLRMIVMLGALLIVRYMADLEYLYAAAENQRRPAFLLDFLTIERSPMRLASQHSYILVCQSITRFYTWMFADYLRSRQPDVDDLAQGFPSYGQPMKSKDESICREVWQEAVGQAKVEGDPYLTYGQAVYDILALLAEATPIQYLRQIGIRCGLFWPPSNLQPTKHLSPRQDMLEVLVRSVASPGEILDMETLQNRLWDTFGLVIGGRPDDLSLLLERGIYQADDRALEENQSAFAQKLSDLNFARLLADGVLEIQVG